MFAGRVADLTVVFRVVFYNAGVISRSTTLSLSPGQSFQLYARMARPSQLLAMILVYCAICEIPKPVWSVVQRAYKLIS